MAVYSEDEIFIIQRKKLILAEGKDDCLFLKYLLLENDDIQIRNFNGKNNLNNDIKVLKEIDGFEDVVSILIVRDSEESAQSAIDSLNYSLNITGLSGKRIEPFAMTIQNNRNIGFVLFPGKNEKGKLYESGTLEHLCLKIFRENSHYKIIKTYLEDFQNNNNVFKRPHKNELHALFSFTDKYVGSMIGKTAEMGGFDFNSQYLLPFLEMFEKM